jgi:hypothetical protein
LQGSKPIGLKSSLYHGKGLGAYMSKMGSNNPFGHLKYKLWPKVGPRVKLAIWLLTTKSQKLPQFPCLQVACNIPLKSSWWTLQLCFNFISIKGLHIELWAPKVVRVSIMGILRLPLASLETKWHLGVGFMAMHRVYYKGEGGGFPHGESCEFVFARGSFVH